MKDFHSNILLVNQIDWWKIKEEAQDLQEDIRKHKSGVLLWVKELYPNYMLLANGVFGNLFENIISPLKLGMKKVVDEYFTLLENVKRDNPNLYFKEINESTNLIFYKIKQPIDSLFAKVAYIKKISQRFAKISEIYSSKVHDYSNEIEPILNSFTKRIINFLNKKGEPKSEREISHYKKERSLRIPDLLKKLRKLPKELRRIYRKTLSEIMLIQSQTFSDISKLNKKVRQLLDDFYDIYGDNDKVWVYMYLLQIKDVDSFHIHFTKFVARLYHIQMYNNRNYPRYIKRRYHPKTRLELKKMLENEMNQKFPKLSDYLRSIFELNKYRKIDAHNVPRVKISNGIAYLSIPEKMEDIQMDLKDINSIIKTYSYFIKALNLPRPKT